MTTKTKKKPRVRLWFVYWGAFEGKNLKTLHGYQQIAPGTPNGIKLSAPDDDTTLRLYGKRFGFAQVGDIVTMECDRFHNDSSVYTDSVKHVGHIDMDEPSVAERVAQSEATLTELEAKRAAKKRPDQFEEVLAPIAQAYRDARTKARRSALLASVIARITRGS